MSMTVVDASQWNSSLSPSQYALGVSGQTYTVQNAGQAYSLTAPVAGTLRFEVDAGDTWSGDPAIKNRSEIAGWTSFGLDTQVNVSYGLQIEPGAANTADFLVLGQFHQTATDSYSPPFAIDMDGEKMSVAIEYTNASGALVSSTLYEDPNDIVRGHTYAMQIQATFDTNNHGHLVVVRDGVTLVDYVGSFGYAGMGAVYWKEGVYRAASSETLAVDYSGLSVSTSAANLTLQPTAPTISFSQSLGFDSGNSSSDFITNNGYVTINGTATAGAAITLSDGATVIGSTKANGFGVWTLSTSLGEGAHALSAAATLSGLTTTYTTSQPIVVDTTKPITATVSGLSSGSVLVGNMGLITSNKFVISGTSEAGDIVQVYADGVFLGKTSADSTGHWNYDNTSNAMASGNHWFSAVAADLAGNGSGWSSALNVTVTNSAPTVNFTETMSYDSGVSATDFVTNNGYVKLTGSAFAGATVTVMDGSTTVGVATANGQGVWTLSAGLAQGSHTLSASATFGGVTSNYSSPQTIVVDTTAPNKPVVAAISPDRGVSNTDGITNTGKLVISGTAEANASINFYADGVYQGATKANASGQWSYDNTGHTLADGAHWLSAVATDLAGNHSAWSTAYNIVVDTATPVNTVSTIAQTSSTFSLSGWAQAGGKVTISEGAVTMATSTVASNGAWSSVVSESQATAHTYLMSTMDAAGNYASPIHILTGTTGSDTVAAQSAGDILWGAGGNDTYGLDASNANGTKISFFQLNHDHINFTGFNSATAHLTQIDSTHWQMADGVHSDIFQISNAPVLHAADYFFS